MRRLKSFLYCTGLCALVTASAGVAAQAQQGLTAEQLLFQQSAKNSFKAEDAAVIKSQYQSEHSLQNMLAHAYRHNPSLRAARSGLFAIQERLPQALSGWKPTVSAGGNVMSADIDGSSFGGTGTTSKEVELSVTQPLFRGGRTVAATDSAMNNILSQRAVLDSTENGLLLSATTAYMDVLRDQSLLELASNNKSVLGKQLTATKDRFDAGELSRTDVAQAEARLARAESERVQAFGNLQTSVAVFEEIIGKEPEGLVKPAVNITIPETLEGSLALGEKYSPDIVAAHHLHKASKEDIDRIFGEILPELGLTGSWNRQYDPQPGVLEESTTRQVGLTASIPLYSAGNTRSRVREAKHTANQRFMEVMEVRNRVRKQIISDWESLKAAQAEIRSRKAEVDAARIAQEGVHEEETLGARTVLDVLDADQELLDAQVGLVTAERNEIVAIFSLAANLGLLTSETLGVKDLTPVYDAHLDEIDWKIFGMGVDRDAYQ